MILKQQDQKMMMGGILKDLFGSLGGEGSAGKRKEEREMDEKLAPKLNEGVYFSSYYKIPHIWGNSRNVLEEGFGGLK